MGNHNINFKNIVRQLLPFHKLQAHRLVWLNALLKPLRERFDEFVAYRKEVRRTMKVTTQVMVFEGYLRTKYNEPVSIKLVTYDDGALRVGLEDEGDIMGLDIPLSSEGVEAVLVPLEFEIRELFGDVDFILYIPNSLLPKIDDIRADIERFKQSLVKYKIEAR